MRYYLHIVLIALLHVCSQPTYAWAASSDTGVFDRAIAAAKADMMADPAAALRQSEKALTQTDKFTGKGQQVARATALWLKIEANIGLNRLDAAQQSLGEALALVKSAAPETKLHGDLMRSQGAVAGIVGKASEALTSYLEAHRIFRKAGEKRSEAMALQDIGQIYWEAGDYERMLSYVDQAQEIYNDDPGIALSANNNRGEAYRALRRWADAEKAYAAALANTRALESPMLEMRVLSNLAQVQIEMGQLNKATQNAALAERLGRNPEARDWLPFVYGVQAMIAIKQGRDQQGAALLDRLFAGTDLEKTDLSYRELHKVAADFYARLGQPERALRHLQAFQRLDGEVRNLITSTSSQLLEARFTSANQKTRIAELKQGQLQRDFEIARQKGTIATGLLIAALALIVVTGLAFLSIRKSRNEVRDANIVLTDVNGRLESALRAKTDFLAMTSHEIRTPLNGIMGMTQIILADDTIDKSTRERVSLVLGAGQTMQALVDDLLDTAKMEGGEITVNRQACDVGKILTESFHLWQGEAQLKGIELTLDASAVPPVSYTDGGRLRQVIFNLLANAIKFTLEGKIALTAKPTDDQNLEILVSDSGIGIPEDQLQLIFEPFHQVNNGMSRDFGGTGLGLSICRNIITALGGEISAASQQGAGSTFRIVLPVAGVAEAASSVAKAGDDATTNLGVTETGRLTLMVDANELRQAKVKAVIEPHVDGVVGARTLAQAEGLLKLGNVGLMIIDTSALPEDEDCAAELANVLASAKAHQAITFLLLAPDNEVQTVAAQFVNADVILQKPLKPAILIAELKKAFNNNNLHQHVA